MPLVLAQPILQHCSPEALLRFEQATPVSPHCISFGRNSVSHPRVSLVYLSLSPTLPRVRMGLLKSQTCETYRYQTSGKHCAFVHIPSLLNNVMLMLNPSPGVKNSS